MPTDTDPINLNELITENDEAKATELRDALRVAIAAAHGIFLRGDIEHDQKVTALLLHGKAGQQLTHGARRELLNGNMPTLTGGASADEPLFSAAPVAELGRAHVAEARAEVAEGQIDELTEELGEVRAQLIREKAKPPTLVEVKVADPAQTAQIARLTRELEAAKAARPADTISTAVHETTARMLKEANEAKEALTRQLAEAKAAKAAVNEANTALTSQLAEAKAAKATVPADMVAKVEFQSLYDAFWGVFDAIEKPHIGSRPVINPDKILDKDVLKMIMEKAKLAAAPAAKPPASPPAGSPPVTTPTRVVNTGGRRRRRG